MNYGIKVPTEGVKMNPPLYWKFWGPFAWLEYIWPIHAPEVTKNV